MSPATHEHIARRIRLPERTRALLATTYMWCASPIGHWWVERIVQTGLPEWFRVPLHYLFSHRVSPDDQRVECQVEAMRTHFARRPEAYRLASASVAGENKLRTADWLAYRSSVPQYWGTFLLLCANACRARTILELGSCIGISGCYLAAGRHCRTFITLEGSAALASIAASHIRQIRPQGVVINAPFDRGLDMVLPMLSDGIDLAYIDGSHQKALTLNYFHRLIPYLRTGSLVVFDDILWSSEMWQAWQELCQWHGITYTINVGRFGICGWDSAALKPKHHDLAKLVGWWRIGTPALRAQYFPRWVRQSQCMPSDTEEV
ncbi:MAG: class I SAM-dependent methyltransferase [Deltaproteobacteria bacterium]|nr:class I SAM-dependent methyltransferase [Deltaproteobacteria bacterium]